MTFEVSKGTVDLMCEASSFTSKTALLLFDSIEPLSFYCSIN